jgi:hypothetical protein
MISLASKHEAVATLPLPRSLPGKDRGMKTPLEPAHSQFGGSVAARILRCPASVGLVQEVPAYLRKPSAWAQRGTALHAAMTLLLDDNPPAIDDLAGKTFDDYTLTSEDVENALRPVCAYVDPILNTPNTEYYLERRVAFPTVAGAFGTADLIVRRGDEGHIIDFKFGSAVRVLALSPADDDPTVDVINSQLLFYAVAARHSLPEFFAGVENIVLTILQPQSIEPGAEMVSTATVTHAGLDEFSAVYAATCAEARGPNPRLQRGNHCRFCPVKPICPEHTKPLLDLAQFAVPTPPAGGIFASPPSKAAYLQALADGLNLVDAVKDLRTALHDQAKRALENGDQVPGYALTAGRAERHWRDDEATAIAALQSLGLSRDDIIAETMRSVKQIEIRATARGLKIPQEFIGSHRSGVSLARCENAHAPVPGRGELARSLSEALAAFQGGKPK